jgi:hypothetical protein
VKAYVLSAAIGLCLALGGCSAGEGPSDAKVESQTKSWETYNEQQLKDNPPPAGEGPGN